MHKMPGLLFVLAAPCVASAPAFSDPADKVCSWSKDDPYLDTADAAVTASNPVFSRQTVTYQTQISGMAVVDPAVPGPPYRICRRYEFANLSDQPIKEFRWPDVGIGPISEVGAGNKFRVPRPVLHNTTDFRNDATNLFAWENIPASGVTVFPATVETHKAAALEPKAGQMYAVEAAQFANALREVSPEGMVLEADYSFYAVEAPIELLSLQSGFSSQLVRINVRSSATLWPHDRYASSQVELEYDWEREGDATIYAPGLAALENLGYEPENDPGEVLGSLSRLTSKSVAVGVEPGGGTKFDLSYGLAEVSGEPALYVVQQPITLRIGEWSACFLASVYAPVPVSFDSAVHCSTAN